MGFFSKVGKLFTGAAPAKSSFPSEEYKGFTITPSPLPDQGQFRIAGLIEKKADNEEQTQQHQFIRSDMVSSEDQAAEITTQKCKVFIDQMGDRIFD